MVFIENRFYFGLCIDVRLLQFTNLNKYGKSVGNSVHQNKEVLKGEWITIHDKSRKLYSDVYHKSTPTYDVDVNKKGYNDWLNEIIPIDNLLVHG